MGCKSASFNNGLINTLAPPGSAIGEHVYRCALVVRVTTARTMLAGELPRTAHADVKIFDQAIPD